MTEFNEPWSTIAPETLIDSDGNPIYDALLGNAFSPEQLERIAVCVTACAGISTADLRAHILHRDNPSDGGNYIARDLLSATAKRFIAQSK
jgi:hypothetical protein